MAQNIVSSNASPQDAALAVYLNPLPGRSTVRSPLAPGHLPSALRALDRRDSQAVRPRAILSGRGPFSSQTEALSGSTKEIAMRLRQIFEVPVEGRGRLVFQGFDSV